jgi:hypothetical protein
MLLSHCHCRVGDILSWLDICIFLVFSRWVVCFPLVNVESDDLRINQVLGNDKGRERVR